MSETRLANVVVPEVFTKYTIEPWYEKSAFFQSGIIREIPEINTLLDGGGKIFDSPFWQTLSGDSTIPSETVDETVNPITASQQDIRRQLRNKMYGQNAVSSIEAGEQSLKVFEENVRAWWTKQYDKFLIASCDGILADNVANDSGDLLKDDSASSFNADGVIDAQGLLGENGTNYVGIMVHSAILARMRKNDEIDFIPLSEQERQVPFYMGMRVVVDDNATSTGTPLVYTTVLFKSGAFGFGLSTKDYEPTSFDRNEKAGMGIDEVATRRVFSIHPNGFSWSDGSVAGLSPTDLELAAAANWDRAYNKQNVGVVFYKSKV